MIPLIIFAIKFRKNISAAAAVEFALIMPALIAVVLGATEYSLILYTKNTAQDAARDTVRRISLNKVSPTDAPALAIAQLPTWVSSKASVAVTQTSPTEPSKNIITVNITFPASAASPTAFFVNLYGSVIVSARAVMAQEALA